MRVTTSIIVAEIAVFALFAHAGTEKVQPAPRAQAEAAAVGVLTQVDALDRLRRGDTAGAIELLEVSLNSNIMVLGSNPQVTADPNVRKILARAAAYRSEHPRRSERPDLDTHVEELLKPYQRGAQ